jgi:hypothetical protein
MVKAAEETLRDGFAHELDIEPDIARPRLAPRREAVEREHVST